LIRKEDGKEISTTSGTNLSICRWERKGGDSSLRRMGKIQSAQTRRHPREKKGKKDSHRRRLKLMDGPSTPEVN